jgi:hypothetical protein
MIAPWVFDEMKTADLKDERLNNRLCEVLAQLASRPTASIPAACGGRAEMTAAYRLFANKKAGFDNLLRPHREATLERVAGESVVVLVQDTTEVEVTRPEQQVVGAGPLDGKSRRGALLHELHAFTPDGTPLGTVMATAWVREEEGVAASKLTRVERAAMPIEEKESYRWVTTLQTAGQRAAQLPATRVVCVADSEADIYEYLVAATSPPQACDWIIRACQDRTIEVAESTQLLRAHLMGQPTSFRRTISVRGRRAKISCETRGRRQPRQSRQAEVEVRAAQVTLRPPWRADRKLPVTTVNAVLISEIDPPPGEQPVEWLLLTSLPINDADEVRQVVQFYCVRWMIEVFFRVLKSGCRVEERLFEHMDRLLACLAVYLIVAWRTLYVCRLGRGCPDASCEAVFEPAEWKSVWKVVRREDPPREPPPLGIMVRLVAQLGGYVHRKPDEPPGPQTVWIGLQRMHDFALCWEMFGPELKNRTPTYV